MRYETHHDILENISDLDLAQAVISAITKHIRDCGVRPDQVFLSPVNFGLLVLGVAPQLLASKPTELEVYGLKVFQDEKVNDFYLRVSSDMHADKLPRYIGKTRILRMLNISEPFDKVKTDVEKQLLKVYGSHTKLVNVEIEEGDKEFSSTSMNYTFNFITTDFAETYGANAAGKSIDEKAEIYMKAKGMFETEEVIDGWNEASIEAVHTRLVAIAIGENVGFWIHKIGQSGQASVRDCVVTLTSRGLRCSHKSGTYSLLVKELDSNGLAVFDHTTALPQAEYDAPLKPIRGGLAVLKAELVNQNHKQFAERLSRIERRTKVHGDFQVKTNDFKSVWTCQFKTPKHEYLVTCFSDQMLLHSREHHTGEQDWKILATSAGKPELLFSDVSEGVIANEIDDTGNRHWLYNPVR